MKKAKLIFKNIFYFLKFVLIPSFLIVKHFIRLKKGNNICKLN
ncbi:MAG: hypothetical protein BAJALOKI3v1_570026 [Promethearchaeota archaeon]|nr:MAG: hypothetical protein BAJALOKI3v1_570026 [Candidatus Lokiarchaeota archaeon]